MKKALSVLVQKYLQSLYEIEDVQQTELDHNEMTVSKLWIEDAFVYIKKEKNKLLFEIQSNITSNEEN